MTAFATWLLTIKRAVPVALILLGLGIGLIVGLGSTTPPRGIADTLPADTQSTQVAIALDQYDNSEDAITPAVVLWTAREGTLDDLTIRTIQNNAFTIGPVHIADDGSAAYGVVPLTANSGDLADKVKTLRADVTAAAPAGVTAQVTGPAGIQADVSAVFEGADVNLLLATVAVVTILLLVTYRSPTLLLIPLLVVVIADRLAVTAATYGLDAVHVPFDESTTGILSVLVLGAGTNYALLLISRYRDELKTHPDRYHAMANALRHAGEAVFASASTVVVGVLTLLLSAFPTTRGLGLASAIGILVAATFVMIVLPCLLVLFGRWIFWPLIPRVGQATLTTRNSLWRKIGTLVADRPTLTGSATIALLLGLALAIPGITTGLAAKDVFLKTPEAITASDRLAQSFPAGASDPVTILTTANPDDVMTAITAVPGVATANISDTPVGPYQKLSAILTNASGTDAAQTTITDLRAATIRLPETLIGGTEAKLLDQKTVASADLRLIVPLIIALVTVVLMLLLRSIVAPILLVATVLGTFAAAMGSAWLLFTHVFGFAAMGAGVPLLALLFLVALGVDYNIFLITRVAEERQNHGVRDAVVRGLSSTGGVITSAGVLLAAVFAVLGVLPLVILAQLGVIICIGVLLDTLLVRTVLVPAIAVQLKDRFWWPRQFPEPQAVNLALAEPEPHRKSRGGRKQSAVTQG